MVTLLINDPDVCRKDAPVDERGRVSVGKALAGENVTVVVERQEEADNE